MTIILITGVAGLFGSHLSRHLIRKGFTVIGVDNCSGGYLDFVDPHVLFHMIDLIDQTALQEIFKMYRPTYVYHLAAYAAEGLSPFIRNFNYTNNLICSANVINCCIRFNIKKIIFTSSMAVYGNNEPLLWKRNHRRRLIPMELLNLQWSWI